MHTEPLHPYTLGLLLAEPSPTVAVRRLRTIPGSVPDAREGRSCVFADRCAWVTQRCSTEPAPLLSAGTGRKSACIRIHEIRDGIIQEIRRVEPAREASDTRPSEAPIVEAAELSKTFERRGVRVEALKSVSITVRPGESVGIVGESGSGKTTLTRCLLGLESPDSGRILFDGVELDLRGSRSDARRFRRDVQVVFQDPYSSLNPARSIGATLCEALGMAPASSRTAQDLLELVGLPPAFAARRPAALSGGQRQRVAIARALAVAPRLIVCDEPVSALDVSVQAQILNLLADIRDELGVAYLFVTHDLAVVRQAVDRVYVMKAGEVLESGSTSDVLDDPSHDYTRRLVAARPAPSRLQ